MIIHLRIEGIVQGVFYRQSTVKKALEIGGISGWVRNRTDGSVEILAKGEELALEQLKNWCFIGSPASTVNSVEELSETTDNLPKITEGSFRKESTF